MITLSTRLLLKLLFTQRGKTVEVSMNNGIVKATHFLRMGKQKLNDHGIDGTHVSWSFYDFLHFYRNTVWKIDQIV